MVSHDLEIRAERVIQKNSIDLHILQHSETGVTTLADPITMTTLTDEGKIQQPSLELPLDTAQQLMDELYRCGLRPTQGTDNAGALEATQNHLKDMQKLTFALLKNDDVEV